MVVVVSAGQSGDSPMLPVLLDHLSVPRIGPGRPRTTPDRLRGDKAYSARGHRSLLRSRGITTTIPEPADQIANRKRRGSSGGRPLRLTPDSGQVVVWSGGLGSRLVGLSGQVVFVL